MRNEQTSNDETLKRWTAKRRVALVLEILRGETAAAEAARRHGLTVAEVDQWKEPLPRWRREHSAQPAARR